ncbi:MAG: CHRD domain-containing protein [Fimbriimonas sp.]
MNQSRLLTALLLLFSLVLAGCSDSSDPIVNPNETQRIGTAGGTFTYQNGNVRLVVPAASLSGETDVTVRAATGFPTDTRLVSGTAWNVSTDNGSSFSTSNKATLRIKYDNLPLGADPIDLKVFRLSAGVWEEMASTVDVTNKIVFTQISATGTYAIFSTGSIGTPEIFRTILSPGQVTGTAVSSTALGTARVEFTEDGSSAQVRLQTSGLTIGQVTSAHIHLGRLGQSNVEPAVTLYNESFGAFSTDYTRTFTAANLNTAVVANMSELREAIRTGNAYVDIHTTVNASGELRGQLGTQVTMEATLNGAQETPEVDTAATGHGTFKFNADMTQLTVRVITTGLNNAEVTAAHIHVGARNNPGPPIFPLYTQAQGAWTGDMTFTLDESDFAAGGGINTYNQAVAAILSGQTYINVHTSTHVNGEIRGQIEPLLL